MPVILSYNMPPGQNGHAVLIIGMNINLDNPLETEYLINDPAVRNTISYTGHQLLNLLNYGGSVLGYGNNFNFQKRKIKMTLAHQNTFYRLRDGDTATNNFRVNFQSAGIISSSQLIQATNIEFPTLIVNENWNAIEKSFTGDSWNPWKIVDNQPWEYWPRWYYYERYFLAEAELKWWTSTKVMCESLTGLVVDFQYKYGANLLLSDSTLDVRIDYGDEIIIYY